MSDQPETLSAIVAEMREAGRSDEHADGPLIEDYADRIEAAVERERRKYERLHECFWNVGAIQNIVRQMLDERDDLRDKNPKASESVGHFAQLLTKAATPATGNAAAMCEALERIIEWADRYVGRLCFHGPSPEMDGWRTASHAANDALALARVALSAPARNCDRYASAKDAIDAFIREKEITSADVDNMNLRDFFDWLFATAKEVN